MGLSIFTSGAAMSSTSALNKSNSILSTSMERLGTGKRINSAADDAAGLQIATRLQGQVNGMSVAQRNVSDATAMLQTAEGAFDEVTNILYRMKDLATQASNATNSGDDLKAMQGEVDQLKGELTNILGNTSFAGNSLIFENKNGTLDIASGKLGSAMSFQIGSSSSETLSVDLTQSGSGANKSNLLESLADAFGLGPAAGDATLKGALKALTDAFNTPTTGAQAAYTTAKAAYETAKDAYAKIAAPTAAEEKTWSDATALWKTAQGVYKTETDKIDVAQAAYDKTTGVSGINFTSDKSANTAIDTITNALSSVSDIRSALGANINRLGHTAANLSNMKDNTSLALGNIRDADFATEATNMTRNQMLAQTSMSMLKQANSMSGMVMSLLG